MSPLVFVHGRSSPALLKGPSPLLTSAPTAVAQSSCPWPAPSPAGALRWHHSAEGTPEELAQFTAPVLGSPWQDTCQSSKNLCSSAMSPAQTPLPAPRQPQLTQWWRSWAPPPATNQNWFCREVDFYFIYLFLKRKLVKSTKTDTAFLSASWTSLPRNQNEILQQSKELADEKLIPKPSGKGKRFERFRSDLLLDLERRCWSPGSAALLGLWLSGWHNTDDCDWKLIDVTSLINLDYLAKA